MLFRIIVTNIVTNCDLVNNGVITIPVVTIFINMKYLCKTCQEQCDDITQHLIKVHHFSRKTVEGQLKEKPHCYDNSFEKL